MKPKTLILMGVAVACGLGASFMTSKLLAERNNKEQSEPTVPVLVAKARVASWQPIRDPERYFEIRQYPQSVAPAKPLSDFPEIKDQRLNKPIDEGKPVSQADLLTKEQTSMAENLQPGQRAIAIKVTAESLVGGFVLPGTRVDVILTTRGTDSSARIILQNMLVLAVDMTDQRTPEQRVIMGQTVTLAATPEESTRLSLAAASGELRLLLKGGGDAKRTYNVVSHSKDLERPLQGDSEKDPDLARTTTSAVPLPELPKEEVKPAPEVKPVEVKPIEVKPEPKKRKRFVMKIRQGVNEEKAVFLLGQKEEDDDEDDAPASSASKKDPEEKAEKPEIKKPAPPRAAPPAPAPAAPVTTPPFSPFGKSTRTGRIN